MDIEHTIDPIDGPPREDQVRQHSMVFERVIPTAATVLVVGLLGLLAYSLIQPDIGVSQRSGVKINENGAIVEVDPKPASDFSLELFDGSTVRLSDYRGQIVVMNFWASWCPPCREEAPALERSWRVLEDEGVVFLGIDVWDERDDALAFLDEFDVTYRNGPDTDGSIAIEYGVAGIPETFIIDREGRIAAKFVGPVTFDQLVNTVRSIAS